MRTLAVLSLHTSPLAQPGRGDSGGMNVYVRELVSSLAQAGIACSVYVRRWDDELPAVVEIEPGFRVVHVPAGPSTLQREELPNVIDEFVKGVRGDIIELGDVDALHANYWLSGVAGHHLKQELDLPLVSTFHTLARVKAETGDPEPERRVSAEAEVVRCSDAITASSQGEVSQLVRLYDAHSERIEVVPPGVVHAFFSPGDRRGARAALGLEDAPVFLFVGRIQRLKGLDVAIRAMDELADRYADATLLVVGGASGTDGETEVTRAHQLVDELELTNRVRFVEPQPHHLLSTYYRAANAVFVPSRSESFGLVALEAAACGTPVIAAAVGGLRSIVEHGRTGFLVSGRDPLAFATHAEQLLDNPRLAHSMREEAAAMARNYTWPLTAARLRRVYADLTARTPVECS